MIYLVGLVAVFVAAAIDVRAGYFTAALVVWVFLVWCVHRHRSGRSFFPWNDDW